MSLLISFHLLKEAAFLTQTANAFSLVYKQVLGRQFVNMST